MPKTIYSTGRTLCALLLLCTSLTACAAPPAFQILSLVLDGVSYLATDKTVADHGISVVTEKDCKMLRTLKGEDICQKETIIEEALIDLEPQQSEPVAQ